MKNFFFVFICLFSLVVQSQNVSNDSLNKMTDKELLSFFNTIKTDTTKAEKVIRFYLEKARKEKDTLKMAKAYEELIFISKPSKEKYFSDSIIDFTKTVTNKNYPTLGYIHRGDYYYFYEKKVKLAIKNYTIAYKLSLKNKNLVLQEFTSDKLIFLQMSWGDNKKTLELQKKRHQLFYNDKYKEELKSYCNDRNIDHRNIFNRTLLGSIQNFVTCYTNLEQLDSASIYIKKGLLKNAAYNGQYKRLFQYFFEFSTAELDYKSKNYKNAIVTINKLLASINHKNIEFYEILLPDLYYYKGLSLIKLDKYKKGIHYLKKSDSIFESNNLYGLLPYHRDLFEKLLTYYSSKGNDKIKLKYLKKLQTVDSIFKINFSFFEPNFIRNYETPQLLEKKEVVITDLEQKNTKKTTVIWWGVFLFIISTLAATYYFKKQVLYKKRFENLMIQYKLDKSKNIEQSFLSKTKKNSKATTDILNSLNIFETQKKFLSPNLSLKNMANSFETNYTYLSKVINQEIGKTFVNYITDLRIEYAFLELKSNPKLRKYTIKAIAKECGYNSDKYFSKKFYKKYGIYPSFYIKKLEKLDS